MLVYRAFDIGTLSFNDNAYDCILTFNGLNFKLSIEWIIYVLSTYIVVLKQE